MDMEYISYLFKSAVYATTVLVTVKYIYEIYKLIKENKIDSIVVYSIIEQLLYMIFYNWVIATGSGYLMRLGLKILNKLQTLIWIVFFSIAVIVVVANIVGRVIIHRAGN